MKLLDGCGALVCRGVGGHEDLALCRVDDKPDAGHAADQMLYIRTDGAELASESAVIEIPAVEASCYVPDDRVDG